MNTVVQKGPAVGLRHVQALLLFASIFVNFVSRISVGMAIVAMTKPDTSANSLTYAWTEQEKSYVLSSFYWGYIPTQFSGGLLCRRFGVKAILFTSSFVTAVLNVMTPSCISWGGWQAYCVIRLILGLFHGPTFPCVLQHIAKWSPPEERNRLGGFSYSGVSCGIVVAMVISGIIADGPMGWPGIFYVSAAMCSVFCLFWLIFGANNASSSRFIGAAERKYIVSSLLQGDDFHGKKIPTPCRAIWTSRPFYALLAVRCAQFWGYSLMQLQTPSYLNGVLKLNIKNNALYSALPSLTQWLCSYVYIVIADMIMKHHWLSLTALRKTFSSIGTFGPAAALITLSFLDESQKELAITLMTISAGLNEGSSIGNSLNAIDLSPNHSGILMSFISGTSSLFQLLSPLFVGVVVTDTSNRAQWQIVFAVTGILFIVGNVTYIIWGRMDRQPWDAEDFFTAKESEIVRKEGKLNDNISLEEQDTIKNKGKCT